MSSVLTPQPKSAQETITVPGELLFRLSVDQYHAMLDAGVLWHGAPVELLEGLLVEKRDGQFRDGDVVIEEWNSPSFPLRLGDYDRMRSAGILTDEMPVEFVDGVLLKSMVRNPPHDTALGLLSDLLTPLVSADWFVRVQSAVRLSDGEPEPDVAIVRGSRRDYSASHPAATDCGLVIEVADSTLDTDRGLKKRTYARHSISEYWIVNLVDAQIEVYTDSTGLVAHPDYRSRRDYFPGEAVPFRIAGREIGTIAVDDVMP